MKNQNEILLNVKQLEEIAKKQSNILNDLQLIQSLMFYMPATGNYLVDDQMDLIHSKLQSMTDELDRSTFILYNLTDKEELEYFGVILEEPDTKTGE